MSMHNSASIHTAQRIPGVLRAVIIACAFWALSLSLTVESGSAGAILGCLIACLSTDRWINARPLDQLRLSSIVLTALGFIALTYWLAGLIVKSDFMSSLLTPIGTFNTAEVLLWFGISCSMSILLRSLALRTRYGGVLEIIFVASAFIITLSAHRNGMIHRPFFIGDYALIRGIDPATILMGIGCFAVIAMSALLMAENDQRRLPYHFVVIALLCSSLVAYVELFGLPTPGITDDMGLTGQELSGNSRKRENPFRDGENTAEDKQAPVAVVVFRDDYEPLNGSYYFRESAYSQFNGIMLDYSTRDDMDLDLISTFTNSEVFAALLPEAKEHHKEVKTTVGMLIPHRNPFGLESPVTYSSTTNPNASRFKRTYDTVSWAPTYNFEFLLGRGTGNKNWSDAVRTEYLQLPADPRYRELAESIVAELKPEYASDPFAKAWAIKAYLDQTGIYSLKNDHAYEKDPAASFLFGDLTGYCMHFSFAATYLYRSLGIPARVGIGYSVPASNRAGGSALLIQAVHGHAWPEIYFKDIGWVIVDPAPQQTLVDMSTDPQNDLQQLLGDMLRDDTSYAEFMESQQADLFDIRTLLTAVAAIAVAFLCMGYAIRAYRFLVPRFCSAEQKGQLAYRAILDQLAAVGMARHYGESREHFAARAAHAFPSIQTATASHLACALGATRQTSSLDWDRFRRALAKEVNENVPAWRRALALINPYSWAFTR
ncbi:MAG: hypothetical protein CBC67_06170 [Gammaproteobacteria bacterium TMED107]|nr:hypothetical protein [Gammaproteobacteria bacterium]OUX74910.1 MAG: hypothetical protein CBC67_06170 [Gammaproteobacteria bacterium TMED107]